MVNTKPKHCKKLTNNSKNTIQNTKYPNKFRIETFTMPSTSEKEKKGIVTHVLAFKNAERKTCVQHLSRFLLDCSVTVPYL